MHFGDPEIFFANPIHMLDSIPGSKIFSGNKNPKAVLVLHIDGRHEVQPHPDYQTLEDQ